MTDTTKPADEAQSTTSPVKPAYFNRELSWLAFNRRVLEQVEDERYPLLERIKFMSFVSSNLDEFFEIRVSGLIQQVESDVQQLGADGLGAREQLRRIHSIAGSLVSDQYGVWSNRLVPALKAEGIVFKTSEELNAAEIKSARSYFEREVFPVLTPMAIDPSHPFPQIGNKTLNILVYLDDPETAEDDRMIAIVPVPRILPRVIKINVNQPGGDTYMFLSDIIKPFVQDLFPGFRIMGVHAFRITRNSDLYIDEEEVDNLLKTIEEELYKLRKGAAVRLEIEDEIDGQLLNELLRNIDLEPEHVYQISGPINLMRLMGVYDLIDRPDLKFKAFLPHVPPQLHNKNQIYDTIGREDQLLHHPYDSFQPVVDFISQAAVDPRVLAIKLTLYRTSSDSPIVQALIDASRNGKQVTALIEIKARFDEAHNIEKARLMEEAGVHVVYGFLGLKTHCKCCLVVRREEGGIRRYVHLGTGNYHPKTAKLYTDNSFFTSRPEITEEVARVFNTLTGFARAPEFAKLLVAPFNLHQGMQRHILREAENAKAGKPARIIVKCNSLLDKETVDNLYVASQAGVKIDLIIRGICSCVPGIKGLSENITVRSILGRYLEHSRIYYFENGDEPSKVFLGSADWMPRNFYRRIEVVFPVDDPRLRDRILNQYLTPQLKDNTNAKLLRSNGSYTRVPMTEDEAPFASQEHFMREAEKARETAEDPSQQI